MTGLEALNAICAECQRDKGKINVACPWRSISGDYCDEYETIKSCIETRDAEMEEFNRERYALESIIDVLKAVNESLQKQLDARCDFCIEETRKKTAREFAKEFLKITGEFADFTDVVNLILTRFGVEVEE